MMDLSKFKPFTMVAGRSFMTISKSGVSFSQAAVVELGKPEYVVILFNSADKEMAIKVATKDEENATTFFKKTKKNSLSVRWNNSLLKDQIKSMMNWDIGNYSYRVEGNYDDNSKALFFDLTSAQRAQKGK